ncbi:hypothetical protein, partial [Priestia megaterium]
MTGKSLRTESATVGAVRSYTGRLPGSHHICWLANACFFPEQESGELSINNVFVKGSDYVSEVTFSPVALFQV